MSPGRKIPAFRNTLKLRHSNDVPVFQLDTRFRIRSFLWEFKVALIKQEVVCVETPVESDSMVKVILELPDRVYLLETISIYFNEGELQTLCYTMGIDYEELGGAGKQEKVRELITYCERHGRVVELIEHCQRLRPNFEWKS
ncbi:MAG: hypothetical protein MN733_35360 [Nitrososphaera sp.]|nr:hypothetical protein [Nitrososphaera sp.]